MSTENSICAKYEIKILLEKHKTCLEEIAKYFEGFFRNTDYSKKPQKQIRVHKIENEKSINEILKGPGFYLIASTIETPENSCNLKIKESSVIYRGHSSNVRERVESHLLHNSYIKKDSARRFTVCMKLEGKNINIDQAEFRKHQWYVVTHSMPKSMKLIREAAEIAFDRTFGKPACSTK